MAGIYHDAGIIYTTHGNYIVCVLTEHGYNTPDPSADFISDVARDVYDYANRSETGNAVAQNNPAGNLKNTENNTPGQPYTMLIIAAVLAAGSVKKKNVNKGKTELQAEEAPIVEKTFEISESENNPALVETNKTETKQVETKQPETNKHEVNNEPAGEKQQTGPEKAKPKTTKMLEQELNRVPFFSLRP